MKACSLETALKMASIGATPSRWTRAAAPRAWSRSPRGAIENAPASRLRQARSRRAATTEIRVIAKAAAAIMSAFGAGGIDLASSLSG
jgi:hypothetical protein